MELGIQNKVALVSGSNRGTGEQIAQQLSNEGVTVIRHGNEIEGFERIKDQYPDSLAVWGNIADQSGFEQVKEQLWQATGRVDILVNNYGTASGGRWEQFEEDQWLDIYQKNVLSCARLIAEVIPQMKAHSWGRIIQLGTIGSLNPNARMPHYYASKGAMANMTASLTKELAHTGITVNTVSPGLILTEELKAGYQLKAQKKGWGESWEEIEQAIVKHDFPNASGRIARREEIADLVCFLASEKASMINGQNLRIDGGSLSLSV